MIHVHHRKKRRAGDERPVNKIGLPDVIHEWVEANPEKAMECGLWVKQTDDPAEIMITIPEEALKKVRPKREKKEKARDRVNVQLRVPKDEQEDGGGVWDDYMRAGRALGEKLGMTWSDTVPDYTVACFFIGKGLLAARDELETEQG